jgi:ATP-dependent protease ClpP protease subunit
MPDWKKVLQEIAVEQVSRTESAFDFVRRNYLKHLCQHTTRNVIAYYSGFLSKPRIDGIDITDDDKNGFMLCIHELDRSRGLDLILHTPGGNIAATESLVVYLREMFGNNIRAIVPQIAMSAGTMIACSCREILMGKHSSLGPVDPHFNGIPAIGVLEEIKRAHQDIKSDPVYAQVWGPILSRLTPSFVQQCAWAVERSKTFITETLQQNMLSSKRPKKRRDQIIEQIRDKLTNLGENKGHDRHFHFQECEQMGLNVIRLEHDDKLQDLVLTIHHCYMHTLANTPSLKIIENQDGKAIVKQQQLAVMQAPISLAPGGSASS